VNRQLIAFRNGTEKYANKLKRDREVGMAALSDKYDKVSQAYGVGCPKG
jgi:peroxiredoxin